MASTATVALAVLASMLGLPEAGAGSDPCLGLSVVACENLQPGTPASTWDLDGAGSDTIQGFATDMSVNVGQTISFKVKTPASAYVVQIYRLGWYQGNGARLVATVTPSAVLPQSQPVCLSDSATNDLDCGNWAVSADWTVPTSAVSGVYIARLLRQDTGADSHIPFVVRNDASHSDLVFQTSDTTWQAYNDWGGSSMYSGPNGPATKVSYNRPWATRGGVEARDFLFANEYPMIRFLERNGYDLSYVSGVDTDRAGSLLTNHKTFVSVGHDEYWSGPQRAHVEAARDAGVNLAFFSGNEVYWKTRWESSIDGSSTSYRTLVCYKETKANAKADPSPEWTGTWRDPRFSPPSDGGRPENALTGTAYMSNNSDLAINVSAAEGKLRFWRGTSAAVLPAGGTETLAAHSIGYESDEDLDNGFRPGGLVRLSTTVGGVPEYLQDYGSTVAAGTTTHHLTMYRAASGAIVFGAGTIQWAWGLDDQHDGTATATNATMQQATINLLADMHAQPTTLMPGRAIASATTDSAAPTVTVGSPAAGAQVANGTLVTVTGTASDAQSVVGGVEVSTDGGSTWHPAQGTASWSYTYVQHGAGTVNVLVRATDDSLNTSAPVTLGLNVTCPCSLFGVEAPAKIDSGDPYAVELGVRFSSSQHGWITGVRFYKASTNTGTHVGTLWSAAGAVLARGTFVNESATGWQSLIFPAPVEVTAGTAYVASYSAPGGHYSQTLDKFRQTYAAAPLTAPAATPTVGNGVYAALGNFPTAQYGAPSYAVDVLFSNVDTYPPALLSTTPVAGASSVPANTQTAAVLSEDITSSSLVMTVATSAGAAVAGTTTYDTPTRTAQFVPAQPLTADTAYDIVKRRVPLVLRSLQEELGITQQNQITVLVLTSDEKVNVDRKAQIQLGVMSAAAIGLVGLLLLALSDTVPRRRARPRTPDARPAEGKDDEEAGGKDDEARGTEQLEPPPDERLPSPDENVDYSRAGVGHGSSPGSDPD
ncbi:MAG: N,N-dimethylformamidase beta subunit family domain-containing protein [Dermatophilaceae bacterium]